MFWGGLTTVPQDQPLVLADGVHGSGDLRSMAWAGQRPAHNQSSQPGLKAEGHNRA